MTNNIIEEGDVFLKTPGDELWKCVRLSVDGKTATLSHTPSGVEVVVYRNIEANSNFNERYKYVWSEHQPGIVQESKVNDIVIVLTPAELAVIQQVIGYFAHTVEVLGKLFGSNWAENIKLFESAQIKFHHKPK